VRFAERAAMLDHFTGRRFEFGTGRGAGSHELASFNIMDKNSTKPEWEEVVREERDRPLLRGQLVRVLGVIESVLEGRHIAERLLHHDDVHRRFTL
jgi:alkanesulfonate monooxygenase SsuD/methylene tetrahydromethanopterin reductase-like flavin-dependent oxidoreductase (luciferase family)